jgi:hypothetical protein
MAAPEYRAMAKKQSVAMMDQAVLGVVSINTMVQHHNFTRHLYLSFDSIPRWRIRKLFGGASSHAPLLSGKHFVGVTENLKTVKPLLSLREDLPNLCMFPRCSNSSKAGIPFHRIWLKGAPVSSVRIHALIAVCASRFLWIQVAKTL